MPHQAQFPSPTWSKGRVFKGSSKAMVVGAVLDWHEGEGTIVNAFQPKPYTSTSMGQKTLIAIPSPI